MISPPVSWQNDRRDEFPDCQGGVNLSENWGLDQTNVISEAFKTECAGV